MDPARPIRTRCQHGPRRIPPQQFGQRWSRRPPGPRARPNSPAGSPASARAGAWAGAWARTRVRCPGGGQPGRSLTRHPRVAACAAARAHDGAAFGRSPPDGRSPTRCPPRRGPRSSAGRRPRDMALAVARRRAGRQQPAPQRRAPASGSAGPASVAMTRSSMGVVAARRRDSVPERRQHTRVAIRASQAPGGPSARYVPSARYARTKASWAASSASVTCPRIR